ncbi:hypothetical protein P0Y35_08745 [Kiritimatiellaeota bacterium B1221]|nr:hypothetical protein [Kiritimatiellaeota bacterium B1221]
MSETPDVVIDALLVAPIRLGGLCIRPYTLQAQLVLERIEHPILTVRNPSLTFLQSAELIFAMSGDPDAVGEAAWSGRQDWEMRVMEFSERIRPADLTELVLACDRQMKAGFAPLPKSSEKKSPKMKSMPSSPKSGAQISQEMVG